MYTAIDMLLELNKSIPAFMDLVTGTAYVFGVFFVVSAIYQFRKLSEQRGMMAQSTDIAVPITLLVVGCMLLWLPNIFTMTTITFFGADSPISYPGNPNDEFDAVMEVILNVMKLIGIIAFIRGWMLLIKAGEGNAGPGTTSKAVTHIVGGLMCYHVYGFFVVLGATLGL